MAPKRPAKWELRKDYKSPLALEVAGHSDTVNRSLLLLFFFLICFVCVRFIVNVIHFSKNV